MSLAEAIEKYVSFKRGLGMRFSTEAILLKAFNKCMGDPDIRQVRRRAVQLFFDNKRPVTLVLARYYSVLKCFYRYAISRGLTTSSPLPTTLPKMPPPFVPYIYTTDELQRLLAATEVLMTQRSPWRPRAFRTFLLLLYGTGMRTGEARSLTLRDVDFDTAVISVRNSKCFKSRLVPIGPQLSRELAAYTRVRRHRQPLPTAEDSALFANSYGRFWHYRDTDMYFRRVCRQAGVVRKDGSRYQPRLHDYRHTAAQHRIEAWYRKGRDVQRLLPQLATYLGHADISCLQYYLHMTPELLREASKRFEHYAKP